MGVPVDQWRQPRLTAGVWWCGDETCDCTRPRIVRLTPNYDAGYPWVRREVVWEGEFLSGTWAYSRAERDRLQFGPLREACGRFGVEVPAGASAAGP